MVSLQGYSIIASLASVHREFFGLRLRVIGSQLVEIIRHIISAGVTRAVGGYICGSDRPLWPILISPVPNLTHSIELPHIYLVLGLDSIASVCGKQRFACGCL